MSFSIAMCMHGACGIALDVAMAVSGPVMTAVGRVAFGWGNSLAGVRELMWWKMPREMRLVVSAGDRLSSGCCVASCMAFLMARLIGMEVARAWAPM